MILVFGATGNVGKEVVNGLVERGKQVRAFSRNPSRAVFDSEVEVHTGDLDDSRSIRAALEGVDAVFMLSAGPDALSYDLAVAEEVRRAGTARVVRMSSVAALPPVETSYGRAHAEADRAFADSGAACTMLRGATFMTNALQWRASIRSHDTVYGVYGTIARALVHPADVAAVAATALVTPGHEGRNYTVTGPEALTTDDAVQRIAKLLGRPLSYVEMPVEKAQQAMVGAGLSAEFTEGLLAVQSDPDPARGGIPLPTVESVTGLPPRTFDSWLKDHQEDYS
ncbi:NAD(P)H-binding protein [Streptomyces sp. SID13666]|uniref:NAD(P)H-binding protein n=1 Tax=unclassified Streptomyces TaxID=2593676 RepID=UPI0013C17515|nr:MULTISPECIES: NAD(P)H-binding protein [unclassified Streptomyces]NEA57499.1 NAD(P)H-binding protein [Streptomyces sp. SID13666]NEA70997.1 NAD(P)H-binding protein [Streptomyces sp. SID13588]